MQPGPRLLGSLGPAVHGRRPVVTVVTVVTDQTTRAELAKTIGMLCHDAKRKPNVVRKTSKDPLTEWDTAHGRINAVLDTYWSTPR